MKRYMRNRLFERVEHHVFGFILVGHIAASLEYQSDSCKKTHFATCNSDPHAAVEKVSVRLKSGSDKGRRAEAVVPKTNGAKQIVVIVGHVLIAHVNPVNAEGDNDGRLLRHLDCHTVSVQKCHRLGRSIGRCQGQRQQKHGGKRQNLTSHTASSFVPFAEGCSLASGASVVPFAEGCSLAPGASVMCPAAYARVFFNSFTSAFGVIPKLAAAVLTSRTPSWN